MTSFPVIDHQKALSYPPSMPKNIKISSLSHKKYKDPNARESSSKDDLLERLGSKASKNGLQEDSEGEEMSQTSKRLQKEIGSLNCYIKLTTQEVTILEESFEMNNYPKVEEMQSMADKLGVHLSKIENWFKHHRRSLAKKGQFDIKTKRFFKPNELKILMDVFKKTPRPSQSQMCIIARQLNCTEYQIKNWYSNKRKRVKLHAKNKKNEEVQSEFCPSSNSPNLPSESPTSFQRSNLPDYPSFPSVSPRDPSKIPSFLLSQSESNENISMFLQQKSDSSKQILPFSNNLYCFPANGYDCGNLIYKNQDQPIKLWPNPMNLQNNFKLNSHTPQVFPSQICIPPQYNNFQTRLNLTYPNLTFQNNPFVQSFQLHNLPSWGNGMGFSGSETLTIQRGNYN